MIFLSLGFFNLHRKRFGKDENDTRALHAHAHDRPIKLGLEQSKRTSRTAYTNEYKLLTLLNDIAPEKFAGNVSRRW